MSDTLIINIIIWKVHSFSFSHPVKYTVLALYDLMRMTYLGIYKCVDVCEWVNQVMLWSALIYFNVERRNIKNEP